MTRSHDMGGRFGDGPIPIKLKDGKFIDDEAVFEFYWHAKALAVTHVSICFCRKMEYRQR